MNWISVEDSLPGDFDKCWTYHHDHGVTLMYYMEREEDEDDGCIS